MTPEELENLEPGRLYKSKTINLPLTKDRGEYICSLVAHKDIFMFVEKPFIEYWSEDGKRYNLIAKVTLLFGGNIGCVHLTEYGIGLLELEVVS